MKVSRTPKNSPNPQAFSGFVAVTEDGHVGILYSDFRNDDKSHPNLTKTDSWVAIYKEVSDPNGGSTGIGLDFVKEIRLSNHSFFAQNGPVTTQGVMTTGDYPFLTTNGNNFYAIHTQTHIGPFTPPKAFYKNKEAETTLFIDDNYRQSPIVSIIVP